MINSELMDARSDRARMDGMIARWCDLTNNVPDALNGETCISMFEAHLKELKDGRTAGT